MIDPPDRPEYVTCIVSADGKHSLCGRYVKYEFHFTSLEHARATVEGGSRLVPCEACLKAEKAT